MAGLYGECGEINAPLRQMIDDLRPLFRVAPPGTPFYGAGADRAHLVARVIGELDDAGLFAVGIQFIDEVSANLDLPAVKIVFAALARRHINEDDLRWFIDFNAWILRLFGRDDFGVFHFAAFVDLLLGGEGGLAV